MACLDGLFAEPLQRVAGGLDAAQTLDQVVHVVDHEQGLAINLVVVGTGEVVVDDAVGHDLKLVAIHRAQPDVGILTAPEQVREAGIPGVARVVVGPHDVELHLFVVGGPQEALVEALLQEGTAVVPVPVVDEDVDAVLDGLVDLHLHNLRVGLVTATPEGLAIPLVVGGLEGHAGGDTHNGLPLTDAVGPELTGTEFLAGVRRPDVGRNIVLLHGVDSFLWINIICKEGSLLGMPWHRFAIPRRSRRQAFGSCGGYHFPWTGRYAIDRLGVHGKQNPWDTGFGGCG